MVLVRRNFDRRCKSARNATPRVRRDGWTLIELMMVVTLISLVALATTFNFAGPLKSARYSSACQQVRDLDHRIRRECLKSNRAAEIQFDLEKGSLNTNGPETKKKYELPSQVMIRAIVDSGGKVRKTATTIRFDGYGGSPTYGVAIGMNERTRWFVFLGRTGECIELENEQETKAFFKSIRSIGANAD